MSARFLMSPISASTSAIADHTISPFPRLKTITVLDLFSTMFIDQYRLVSDLRLHHRAQGSGASVVMLVVDVFAAVEQTP